MRQLLMALLSILILVGCASNIPTVIPPMEKYCPRPVRPTIEEKPSWDIQSLLQVNLTLVDYSLKLEASLECWDSKAVINK